jgi:hypothetical protein
MRKSRAGVLKPWVDVMSGAGGWLPAAEAIAITVDPTYRPRHTDLYRPARPSETRPGFVWAPPLTSFRMPRFARPPPPSRG